MTTINVTTKHLPTAPLGADNPLPHFWWQQPGKLMDVPPVGLSDEEMEGYVDMGRASILPYTVQDNYHRNRQDHEHRIIEIDNGKLKLTVLPDLGGRLYSMVDLVTGREMLFCNPVIQPANLSLRNAWFSGGIEWNGGAAPGHAASTCSPIFAHRVDTERGPVLRLHEFDRSSETAWQIDLYLPNEEARCYVHGRIVNPNAQAQKIYWWTNATVPYVEGMRVVAPADYSIEHILPDNHLEKCEFPSGWGFEASYPANWKSATSVFFRKSDQELPWISACFPDGYGVGQISTANLKGRKYFFFGNGEGGRHWMEYLSEAGKDQYVEIQAGLMPTQNQLKTLGPNMSIEWTECYMPLTDCAEATKGDYQDAVAAVGQKISTAISAETLSDVDVFLTKVALIAPTENISQGSGWGQLYEGVTGVQIGSGMDYTAPPVEKIWEDIAAGKAVQDTAKMPRDFAISDKWLNLLEVAIQKQPDVATLYLLQGIIALDRDEANKAEALLKKAFDLKADWATARCLAVLYERIDDYEKALRWYERAREFEDCPPQVALELGIFLKRMGKADALVELFESLPELETDHERLRILRAEVALLKRDYDKLGELLDYPFATVREGEVIMSDLWESYVLGKTERDYDRLLSDHEKTKVLRDNPIPFEMNFMMNNDEA